MKAGLRKKSREKKNGKGGQLPGAAVLAVSRGF